MICIIGANGNMGKRYQSVCKYLNIPFKGLDVNDPLPVNEEKFTHYLIATPTVSHEKSSIISVLLIRSLLRSYVRSRFSVMILNTFSTLQMSGIMRFSWLIIMHTTHIKSMKERVKPLITTIIPGEMGSFGIAFSSSI